MCYSKEFSLVSGGGMSIASIFFWLKFIKLRYIDDPKVRERAMALRPFLINAILAYACIGGHQIGEFFAILWGDQLVYKIGLISSISSIYFGTRAIEKLTKVKIGSEIVLAIIALVSLNIFMTTFEFENRHFWIRGYNHSLWSTAWFTLWTYGMFSGLYLSRFYETVTNKKLLRWAFLGVMNVSFIFSIVYAILGNLSTQFMQCTRPLFEGFVFGMDFPSIWCTFSVIQAPFLYFGFMAFVSQYVVTDTPKLKGSFVKPGIMIALATLLFMTAAKFAIPIIFDVSLKMITK